MNATNTAWETYHRRAAALRDVMAHIESTGGTEPLWDKDGVFADEADLLVALHAVWARRLEARVELAMELGEDLPAEGVATAWRELSRDMPGVRRVLDDHRDHPALVKPERHQNRLLAIAAGLVSVDDPIEHAAGKGAALVERVRAIRVPEQRQGRLRDRISPTVSRGSLDEWYREAAARGPAA